MCEIFLWLQSILKNINSILQMFVNFHYQVHDYSRLQ